MQKNLRLLCFKLKFMAKKPTNHNTPWSKEDVKKLQDLAAKNTPTRVIGLKLGRTESSVQSKASQEEVSLKPTNQSPYGTKKKG
jgi:hypothetical protein